MSDDLLAIRYAKALENARSIARSLGYAIAVHGSQRRDLDLLAVPWTDKAVSASALAYAIANATGGRILVKSDPKEKPHGRLAWSICFDGPPWTESGPPFIDLSVMPRIGDSTPHKLICQLPEAEIEEAMRDE